MFKLSKSLILLALFSGNAMAKLGETASAIPEEGNYVEHLDLELEIEGERQLFPLLPGVACPTGHTCRTRNVYNHNSQGMAPMISSLKNNLKDTVQMTMDWQELSNDLTTVVDSGDRCTRRNAMAKAAGMIGGLGVAAVSSPAYAAQTTEVKMGSDAGLLAFVPATSSICVGDTVKWINNKAGPHNVVFDEDAIPEGVDQEKISMDDQLGEEGDTFEMKFDTAGTYEYYCEPHRGAGMQGKLTVA